MRWYNSNFNGIFIGAESNWLRLAKICNDASREISGQMNLLTELQLRGRYMLGPILCSSFILYITYHTLQGDRGLIAFWQLHGQIAQAKHISGVLNSDKKLMEKRVNLLNPRSLDTDMLEERVRIMLGYSRPEETIFITK